MRSKKRIGAAPLTLVLVLIGAAGAGAQQGTCMLDGQRYPEDAVVCSNGLALYCTNGVWQNNEGQRCEAPSGGYLGPRRPLEERNPEPIPEFYKERYPGLEQR